MLTSQCHCSLFYHGVKQQWESGEATMEKEGRRGEGMKNEWGSTGRAVMKRKSDIQTSAYIVEKVVHLCNNGHLLPAKLPYHAGDTDNWKTVRRYDAKEVGEAALVWQSYIGSCVTDLKMGGERSKKRGLGGEGEKILKRKKEKRDRRRTGKEWSEEKYKEKAMEGEKWEEEGWEREGGIDSYSKTKWHCDSSKWMIC